MQGAAAPVSRTCDGYGVFRDKGIVPTGRGARWSGARTMVDDIDVYRSASALISAHGEAALMEADKRAASLRERGDKEGHAVWVRIGMAVEELLRDDRDTDEPVH